MYVLLHFLPSAYGRYASRAFGVLIPARIAWFLQDLPAVVIPLLVFFNMEHTQLHLANYIVSSVLRYSTAELAVLHSLYDGKCLTLNLHPFFCELGIASGDVRHQLCSACLCIPAAYQRRKACSVSAVFQCCSVQLYQRIFPSALSVRMGRYGTLDIQNNFNQLTYLELIGLQQITSSLFNTDFLLT